MYKRIFLSLIIVLLISTPIHAESINWEPVNYSNPDSISENGLSIEEFNNLSKADWLDILGDKKKVNFAFSAADSEGNDITNSVNPNLSINVDGISSNQTVSFEKIKNKTTDLGFNYKYSLNFNGYNSRVSFPNYDKMNLTNVDKETVDLFFKTSDDIFSRQVLYEEGGATNGINLYIYNNNLYLGAYSKSYGWSFKCVKTTIEKNTNYRATFVFDSTQNKISGYLNGVLFDSVYSSNISTLRSHNPLTLGRATSGVLFEDGHKNSTSFYFKGEIYEVRNWYERALTEEEIEKNPAQTLIGNENDLIGLWLIDENTSTIFKDKTTNGYDGNIQNVTILQK